MTRGEILDRATTGVAVGGVTMPAWWPSLHQVSEVAGQLVPVLSVAWLGVQIFEWARKRRGRR